MNCPRIIRRLRYSPHAGKEMTMSGKMYSISNDETGTYLDVWQGEEHHVYLIDDLFAEIASLMAALVIRTYVEWAPANDGGNDRERVRGKKGVQIHCLR
jgi:hypothetical protein